MGATLELPAQTKERLAQLRDLSVKAEDGDKDARKELKELLRESSPEVIVRASDVGRRAQHMLIGAVGGGDPLTEYALSARLDMLRAEIGGENLTPLEVLLTEQVVSCWLWLQLLDAFLSGQFGRDFPAGHKRVGMLYLLRLVRFQESAQRRFLAAIKALAQVRKLQANTLAVQYNTQINMGPPPT